MVAASRLSGPSKIDAFINFRGKDTRRTFICHLFEALKDKPIGAFYDRVSLEKGTRISELLTFIDHSRLSIVVFSENYADSIWCLKELVRIVQCRDNQGQIVVPIFYGVKPYQIRHLLGNFATAFEKHDHNSEIDKEEVGSWKKALIEVSNISGWVSSDDEDDTELIDKVVEDIYIKLNHISSSKVDGLVGMDNHKKEMNLLLCLEVDDVRCVAIWETGAIGKSTIARATFCRFKLYCFFGNVEEDFKHLGAVSMQEKQHTRGFDNIIKCAIEYAQGLPSTVRIFGTLLHIKVVGFNVLLSSL